MLVIHGKVLSQGIVHSVYHESPTSSSKEAMAMVKNFLKVGQTIKVKVHIGSIMYFVYPWKGLVTRNVHDVI